MKDVVIKAENITKKFKIYKDKPHTIKDYILRFGKNSYEVFEALSNVNFSVEKGETIGILGKNGSGKSTLLKIINRTLYQDSGKLYVKGKVASLIELGAGFHPDMTGRENIYNNASIFGLNRKEIEARIDSIISFSELEDFIDNPVRTYSSGMYARLAFAVAINVDADILLVDEILSVGDINFQAKCNNYMLDMQKSGVTIIVVSHDLGSIERMCDKALLLEKGKVAAFGKASDIRRLYMEHMADEFDKAVEKQTSNEKNNLDKDEECEENIPLEPKEGVKRFGNHNMVIKNVTMKDANGNIKNIFTTGEDIRICYDYVCNISPDIIDPNFGFGITKLDGTNIYGTNIVIDKLPHIILKSTGNVEIYLEKVMLLPGDYSLQVAVIGRDNTHYDFINDVLRFRMVTNFDDVGTVRLEHRFIIDGKKY